ncbi:uncharacterized protein At2g29880-like [Humulus lupulus]|uniref:uncharacterized protein At2g29880-like n=1 Tax=Humulus lupulus TaxID=3486 RepID=UPI002B411035|nr:uncharacterized protein At2g29880-like [Humulus lupulus]
MPTDNTDMHPENESDSGDEEDSMDADGSIRSIEASEGWTTFRNHLALEIMETSKGRGPGQNKRFWSEDEDKHLIEALMELNNEGKFKAEGNFRPGHLRALEMKLMERMPACDIQAKPHIESRMKTHFQVVHEMLTEPFCSGFGWDNDRKTVTAEKSVWEAYLQSHKEATPLKIKSFPWYDDLCMVFGKDLATGKNAETTADVVEELQTEEENTTLGEDDFNYANNVDEVPAMSVSDATRGAQSHTQSDGSSKKKRKTVNHEELSDALTQLACIIAREIEKAYIRLSKAIGEDMNENHMQLGKDVPDNEKDEWVTLLLDDSL